MSDVKPAGLIVIAVILGLVGTATLVAYAALPFGQTPLSEVDPVLLLLGFVYGSMALFAARRLWRLDPSGPNAFLAWCASIIVFNLYLSRSVAEFWNPWLVPAYVLLLGIFAWSYRYTRKVCRPAT